MRRFEFEETLGVLLVADVLTAGFRWWRGASGLTVFLGFTLGVLVSLVMSEALTRLGKRDQTRKRIPHCPVDVDMHGDLSAKAPAERGGFVSS